jgi:hypothetical protein
MRSVVMSNPNATELAAFLGPVADRDAEVIERWRNASPAAHARAMIELSGYAERMAAQTGLGKDPGERFPGIPEPSRGQKTA